MIHNCKAILVPTNNVGLGNPVNYPLMLSKEGHLMTPNFGNGDLKGTEYQAQQLHFVADKKIKKGDWYFDEMYRLVLQASMISTHNSNPCCKKIIATTNPRLLGIALIPNMLIKSFVRRYNDNLTTDIDLIISEIKDNKLCDRPVIVSYLFKEPIDIILSERNKASLMEVTPFPNFPTRLVYSTPVEDYDNTVHHGDDM